MDVPTEATVTEPATNETTGLYCAYYRHSIMHGDTRNHTVGNSDSKRCQYSFARGPTFRNSRHTAVVQWIMVRQVTISEHLTMSAVRMVQPTLYLAHVVFV